MIGVTPGAWRWIRSGDVTTNERGESMEKYVVSVLCNENVVIFRFNELADAMEFVSTCIETADVGTTVQITQAE